ncbi:MAG: 30S ribosomal protein S21 [Bacteroidia bacterium]|nr:30S ribosomal protein S21 [Bacteroidia bacterium]
MIIVEVKEGESLDRALRRYKKKFERLGILKEIRYRSHFTTPSESRRETVKKAQRRQRYNDAQNV